MADPVETKSVEFVLLIDGVSVIKKICDNQSMGNYVSILRQIATTIENKYVLIGDQQGENALFKTNQSWANMVVTSTTQFENTTNKSKLKPINVNYKFMLPCRFADKCEYAEVWIDDNGCHRRKCQYLHSDDDCELGSRWCNILDCDKIHGCERLICEFSEYGNKYNGRPCKKLFSCPFGHADVEYEYWVRTGLYDKWIKDPIKYINPVY